MWHFLVDDSDAEGGGTKGKEGDGSTAPLAATGRTSTAASTEDESRHHSVELGFSNSGNDYKGPEVSTAVQQQRLTHVDRLGRASMVDVSKVSKPR